MPICERNTRAYLDARAKMGNMTVGNLQKDSLLTSLGTFPRHQEEKIYILTCTATDHFTSWVEIYPISDLNAASTARVLLNEDFGQFGFPLTEFT